MAYSGQVLGSFRTVSDQLEVLVRSGVTCVVLEGPQGCGKTSLVRGLATRHDKKPGRGLLYLHLGEQIDGKSLLGTFTSTGSPGQFRWELGVLTKAVQSGWWVVLEDIDSAPADVVSLLLPLVKGRHLILPGRVDAVKAKPGFMMFLTQRSDGYVKTSAMYQVLCQHCAVLNLEAMTTIQQAEIVRNKYSNLSSLAEELVDNCSTLKLHMRKLLKLCERVSPQIYDGKITSVTDFMLEVLDTLCGHLQLSDRTHQAAQLTHLCGGMAYEKMAFLCSSHKPAVMLSPTMVSIGRAFLPRTADTPPSKLFVHTQSSLALLERVCVCVAKNEPVLLVGETGVGKTATVSYLAQLTGAKLVVMNMSQQTDSTDLLGGYKPIHLSQLLAPVRDEFERLFMASFSGKKNKRFLEEVQVSLANHKWKKFLDLMLTSIRSALCKPNLKNKCVPNLLEDWKSLRARIRKLRNDLRRPRSSLAFAFIEGALVEAVRRGQWILLDEINLATAETLQCLSSLLESASDSFILPEKPDCPAVERSTEFRLFCCMNPATDVGKKQLAGSLRSRFTELYVEEVQSSADLQLLVRSYLTNSQPSNQLVRGIIKLYTSIRELAESSLEDGTGRRPHYSLRSLCRALSYADSNPCGTFTRSLYEGFCLTLLSELCPAQHDKVKTHIRTCLQLPDRVACTSGPDPSQGRLRYKKVGSFWLKCYSSDDTLPEDYIVTPSVHKNLENLARAISARNYPVLLQGPTSAGKTSCIQYLARVLGQQCLRINNHEHTDLQEYVGSYTSSQTGELIFQEGVLVTAMKKGHWIILDELNLAPTEVLEALNRVLDDNRELFIAETQELVKASPNFMLFGTQNPPGAYGGRKVLSRAFRNRFIELHFEDIPTGELVEILHRRCQLPQSYASKMVLVMKDLQERRSVSGIFAGKYGLITLRDLFRWAERYRRSSSITQFHDWDQQLAEDGYMLLSGRLRVCQDQAVVQEVIEKHFKRQLDPAALFGVDGGEGSAASRGCLASLRTILPEGFTHLVWTDELLKVAVLLVRCLQFDEPVLLVGNTGCGKTSLCQLVATLKGLKFFSINCHLHTEAADFLGGLRPVRHHLMLDKETKVEDPGALFEWVDGVVVRAMKEGGCLMVDEISLADDAVLERLNSVLEPERKLVVSEKSRTQSGEVFQIVASAGFQFLATMNPGGDYGKKELSPALRNRFVEIWCSSSTSRESYGRILRHNLNSKFTEPGAVWVELMLEVLDWLKNCSSIVVSIRDILTWVQFMNSTSPILRPAEAFFHGAHLVFLDAMGCDSQGSGLGSKEALMGHVRELLKDHRCGEQEDWKSLRDIGEFMVKDYECGIQPFMISRGTSCIGDGGAVSYSLDAPGPRLNAFRLLRAMQLCRPLLLEGAPGVGKTSLVTALAKFSGHDIVRINLSEQTDVSDLFGADLPMEGKSGAHFEWRDGPFLKALRNGDWVVLDEMNLASQSVLEGLNACLDHRGEVYIPELGMAFQVPVKTKIFACQNPLHQGGGRKGLPKSFLNRFTQVYVEPLSADDLLAIVSSVHPKMCSSVLEKMIEFTLGVSNLFQADSFLWEFNLRDVFRWCELMTEHQNEPFWDPGQFVQLIFCSRLRDSRSRELVCDLFQETFKGTKLNSVAKLGTCFKISPRHLKIGDVVVDRSFHYVKDGEDKCDQFLLHAQLPAMEVLLSCVKMDWMAILAGPACSGKSSLVRNLAALLGQRLLEFPMNSDTDTIDLLGGYEQADTRRSYQNLLSHVQDVCTYLSNYAARDGLPPETMELVQRLANYCFLDVAAVNVEVLEEWSSLIQLLEPAVSNLPRDLSQLADEVRSLQGRVGIAGGEEHQFEWVDSVLVKALECGHWLLISHANFCSPSVLDRLNALLEPGGVLQMDERGLVGGSVKVVRPHPNFRLFLTMDPNHGEISRAMRNRGVEIFLLPQDIPARGEFPEDTLSLLGDGAVDRELAWYIVRSTKGSSTPFQLKLFGRIFSSLKMSEVCSDSKCLSDAAALSGLNLEVEPCTSGLLPILLELDGIVTPLDQLCTQPLLSVAKRELLPSLRELKAASLQNSSLVCHPLLSSHLLVYLCCSTADYQSLRLSLLQDAASAVQDLVPVHAQVDAWRCALERFWEETGSGKPCEKFQRVSLQSVPDSSILFNFCILGLEFLLKKHVLLATSSSLYDSIIALSHRAFTGSCPVEKLVHSSLLYLHRCLSVILSVLRKSCQGVLQCYKIATVVDWLWAFISVAMDRNADFSAITCAWSLLRKKGLQQWVELCDQEDKEELVGVLDCLRPLEDIMSKNNIYMALRQHIGAPEPCDGNMIGMKDLLQKEDETITGCSAKTSLILSEDLLKRRQHILEQFNKALENDGDLESPMDGNTTNITQSSNSLTEDAAFLQSSNSLSEDAFLQYRQQALLVPAVACFRGLLLSRSSLPALERNHMIQYLLKLPWFHVGEIEPLLVGQLKSDEVSLSSFLSVTSIECLFSGLDSLCSRRQIQKSLISTSQSILSPMCYNYLCPSFDEVEEESPLHRSLSAVVTLGNCREKQAELKQLLQFLWLHGSAGVYKTQPYLSGERTILKGICEQILSCIRSAILSVDTSATTSSSACASSQSIAEVCYLAESIIPDYAPWNIVKSYLKDIVSLLEEFDCLLLDSSAENELELLVKVGVVKCRLGVTLCRLFCPAPVDPIVTARTEYLCYQKQMDHVSCSIEAWHQHFLVMTGRKFSHVFEGDRLPQILSLLQEKAAVLTDILGEYPILPEMRCDGTKYWDLSQMTNDVMNSLCSEDRIDGLLREITTATKDGMAWLKVASWTKAVVATLRKLKVEFNSFPDIVAPFSAGLTLILDGITVVCMINKFRSSEMVDIFETVLHMSSFPITNSLEDPLSFVKYLYHLSTDNAAALKILRSKDSRKSVILLALSYLTEHVQSISLLRNSEFPVVEKLLDYCWSLWLAAEADQRARNLEEESLYKYRSKTHVIQESEDEVSERQLREMFPSYKELMDEEMSVEEMSESEDEMETEGNAGGDSDSAISFNSEELYFIANLHLKLYHMDNIPLQMAASRDMSYKLGSSLTRLMEHIPGMKFDGSLLTSHILKCGSALSTSSHTSPPTNNYNIYKDPAPVENIQARDVIYSLQSRLQELLSEWPEHPTLLQIVKGCDKVLSLELESPLMKSLAGLEYVLKKAQDWEAYASRHVSILPQLEAITQLVLEWRKKELNSWKKLLEASKLEVVLGSYKWWFHIYGLCKDFITGTAESLNDFISSLQQFMETSTLGEFSTRLCLVHAFYLEMTHKGLSVLAHPLGNVYMFYKQFSEAVEKSVHTLGSPVEKEFSEQLSILRWNDGNYWSVKASTEKSHRTILRLFNKHKAVLQQPVKPVLTDSSIASMSGKTHSGNEYRSALKEVLNSLKERVYTSPASIKSERSIMECVDLGDTISTGVAYKRMKGYVQEYCKTSLCHLWSFDVDELTDSIIETVHDLQSEAYLKGLESEKRKAAIKLRGTQKRKALGELFKKLKQEGLSYRKIIARGDDDFALSSFKLPTWELPHVFSLDVDMKKVWGKAQLYYYRCIARIATFQSSFQNPSKELSLGQVTRCQGYISQLLTLVSSQRQLLHEGLSACDDLSAIAKMVKDVVTCKGSLVALTDYMKWLSYLGNCAELSLKTIKDFKLLISTLPEELDFSLTPFLQENFPKVIRCGNRSVANEVSHVLENHSSVLTDVYQKCVNLEKNSKSLDLQFVARLKVDELVSGFEAVGRFLQSLSDVIAILEETSMDEGMFSFLNSFYKSASDCHSKFCSWLQSSNMQTSGFSGCDVQSLKPVIDGSAKGLFLDMQKLMISYRAILTRMTEDPENFQNIKSLNTFTVQTLNTLRSSWMLESTLEVLTLLPSIPAEEFQFLEAWQILLDQYTLFYTKVITDTMVSHYALCKLLSVLLETFTFLISKGFCTPNEELDSKETEGTEFVDIEAGGFDEGQGESNVSKTAEKDNLDGGGGDGREDRQEKEEDDKVEEEDAVEMDEDFEGDIKDVDNKDQSNEDDESEVDDDENNQMGDLEADQPEELDRNMWAQEEEKEEDDKANKPCQKEPGGGSAEDDETKIVAKDDDAGTVDTDDKKKDQNQGQEEADESTPIEEKIDYEQQPPEDIDPVKNEKDLDLGDLSVDDIASDSDQEESKDCESGVDSEPAGGMDSDEESEIGGDTASVEDNKLGDEEDLSQNDDIWSKDQTCHDGIEPSSLDDNLEGNPNAQMNESQEVGNDEQNGDEEDKPSNGGSDRVSQDQLREEQQKEKVVKRPNPSNLEDRQPVSDEDNEAVVKRPKLIEADESQSMQDNHAPASSELSTTYQHLRGREGECHDAVVWDVAQSEHHVGSTEEPPELECQESDSEEPMLDNPAPHSKEDALEQWLMYERSTFTLSQLLYEELRLILLPTKAAQLKGDFRTGKRLNMRRIIPYIASSFQNDRIWLRRSKPSQREYQILLAVDDSLSMNENKCMQMAYESLALVSNALNKLEAGQLGVCRFGESVEVLHPLNKPFTYSSGTSIIQNLSFSQTRTNFIQMLSYVKNIFSESRQHKTSRITASTDQLLLILSDGRGVFADGSHPLQRCIKELNELNIFVVFIILDSLYKDSVVDIKVPTFTAGKPLQLKTYLETFPFNFYIVLQDVKMLPHILGQALRQWFELVAVHSAT